MSGPGASGRSGRRGALIAAGTAATILAVLAGAARVIVEGPGAPPLPDRLVPALAATALLCCFGLLVRRAPRAAWASAAGAAGIAAVDIIALVRSVLPTSGVGMSVVGEPIVLVAYSGLGALTATLVAIGYAADPSAVSGSRARAVLRAGAAVTGLSGAFVVAWAIGSTPLRPSMAVAIDDDAPIRIMARVLLGIGATALAIGIVRDLGGAAGRARARLAAAAPDPPASALAALGRFMGALADELVPIRVRERDRATEAERAKLSADLHALVLPDLRRAVDAAERGTDPAAVATGIRRSLEGIERLMHERQSVVLEGFGLVAALEWLAERTEEQGGIVVDLKLEGDEVAEKDAVPAAVARVAFRVALLALDNVVRHAGASRVTTHLIVDAAGVSLSVIDDGHRGSPHAAAPTGRGLRDMHEAAESIGARLVFHSDADGTVLDLVWPAPSTAGQPAMLGAHPAARPGPIAR